MAVSYRLLGNTQDALEVTQDAFLEGLHQSETLQKPEAFGGWLMRIVSNLSLNYRRSRKTRNALPLAEVLARRRANKRMRTAVAVNGWPGRPTRRGLEGKELGAKLKEALAQLPENSVWRL